MLFHVEPMFVSRNEKRARCYEILLHCLCPLFIYQLTVMVRVKQTAQKRAVPRKDPRGKAAYRHRATKRGVGVNLPASNRQRRIRIGLLNVKCL